MIAMLVVTCTRKAGDERCQDASLRQCCLDDRENAPPEFHAARALRTMVVIVVPLVVRLHPLVVVHVLVMRIKICTAGM